MAKRYRYYASFKDWAGDLETSPVFGETYSDAVRAAKYETIGTGLKFIDVCPFPDLVHYEDGRLELLANITPTSSYLKGDHDGRSPRTSRHGTRRL